MVDRRAFPQFLRRPQASEYLAEVWGLSYTPGTISKLCSLGRGPETHHAGRTALHTPEALDEFARSRIKSPVAFAEPEADLAVTSLSTAPLPPIPAAAGEWRAMP